MIEVLLAFLAMVLLAIEGTRKLRQPKRLARSGQLSLPPGPPPLPFIGNMLEMNKDTPYLTYTAWSKTYGDIVYARVPGKDIIVLNSEVVAITLLEKRSQKYSDRPVLPLAELFGRDWTTVMARYGPRFRLHRRLLHQFFHERAALVYRPAHLQRAYEMLTHVLDDPARYASHLTTFSASVVMAVTYGYDIKGGETFVTSMQRASDIFLRVATPEASALYSVIPFAKLLPAWIPGMGFKSGVPECRRLTSEALNTPYAWVKRHVERGTAVPCMVADAITRYHLQDDSLQPELVRATKESAGTLYTASVETTNSILLTFVYLMMNHPQVQYRAQAEIDCVVGQRRLPRFEDRTSLPYVDAVLRETMRWHPVTPIGALDPGVGSWVDQTVLGVPHATSEDDIYEGYYIPKGAVVIANLWAMSRNEKKYPNPEDFRPERFLQDNGTLNEDDVLLIFGFGRRMCPGRHVADASLWCAIVCMLAFFTIEKTEGSEDVEWATGITTHPLPFSCRIVPRNEEMDSPKLASLICASHADL